jgi:hypothetical protein
VNDEIKTHYDINELIALLESTDRGGWKLNIAIHRLQSCKALSDLESIQFESRHFVDSNSEGFYFGPSYTQSLDAAMSLLPTGWTHFSTSSDNGKFNVTARYTIGKESISVEASAEKWPLAICAVALKMIQYTLKQENRS